MDVYSLLEMSQGATIEQMQKWLVPGSWVVLENGIVGCVIESDKIEMTVAHIPTNGDCDATFTRVLTMGDNWRPTKASFTHLMQLYNGTSDVVEYHVERNRHLSECVPFELRDGRIHE